MAKVMVGILCIVLAGCASKAETLGTAGGAAVGYGVTGGSAIGTLGGAAVGYGAGKVYDDKHDKNQ